MLVDFLHLGDVGVHAHVGEVGELGGVRLAERVVLVEHALEGEQHVVGVELAGRLEVVGGVELHALAQVEGVGLAVIGDVPFLRQPGDDLGAAALELGEAVEDRLGGGVEVGAGGVLAGIEAGGAAFRAVHQVAGGLGERGAGDEPGGDHGKNDGVLAHADLWLLVFSARGAALWAALREAMQGICLTQAGYGLQCRSCDAGARECRKHEKTALIGERRFV
ncbi:hypothetical protein D9M68_532390 [compost metagenome]